MAHDAQGDPAKWDAGLDTLAASGWSPEVLNQFRGRTDLAQMLERSALTQKEELQNNYNMGQLELSRKRLAFDMIEAAKAPPPTAAQSNWDWAQGDPAKEAYLGIGQAAGARPLTVDERTAWGIPETDTGAYSIEPGKAPQRIGGAPLSGPSAPAGYRPTDDGNLTYIPGGPADPVNKPRAEFNVSQAAAAGYADRMVQADALLSDPALATVQTDVVERGKASVPFGIGNMLTSPEFQQADQAQRDFINAILRRESGAVISESEFASARQQYFPQPGDSPQVLAQKAANRKTAIAGVARAAGPAYEMPDTTNYLTGAPTSNGNAGGWEVIGVDE
jgi:hypothetical protein